jgi:hypothetical protein
MDDATKQVLLDSANHQAAVLTHIILWSSIAIILGWSLLRYWMKQSTVRVRSAARRSVPGLTPIRQPRVAAPAHRERQPQPAWNQPATAASYRPVRERRLAAR